MQLILPAPPYLTILAVRFPWCLCYRKLDEVSRKEERDEERATILLEEKEEQEVEKGR